MKKNILKAEDNTKEGRFLPIAEEFYSVQGEGYNTGKAAYFIRIGGCDIGCFWCDAKDTWNAVDFPPINVDEVIDRVMKSGSRAVVVTGGEPALYNLEYLTRLLKINGIETFLETSGSEPISGYWDWICISPKHNFPPIENQLIMADELKVIVFEDIDFDWAESFMPKVKKTCKLYLQPEWSSFKEIIPQIVEYVKSNNRWEISLQSHKFMRIP
ncbi:MAG: 7-carboxy-7-deazaguanine synthase QueE [Bacteroidales bacterium]|nr:7-carboxy-7-deazaguanine synthase QueE [Bacteroidales bacterium]MDY0217121.1 7-carboxy-7-deazaguanine synthase QueE [Bacteroidales bacterium]